MPIAVLTNFEQLIIVDCRYQPNIDTATQRIIQKYHNETEKFAEIFYLFSRDAVAANSLEKYGETLPKDRGKVVQRGLFKGGWQPVDESFLADLDSYRDALARNLKNHNSDLDGEILTEITQRTLGGFRHEFIFCLTELFGLVAKHGRIGISRTNAVDPDVLRTVVNCHGTGHVDHRSLRSAIRDRVAPALDAPARSRVDDRAAALFNDFRDGIFAHQKDGFYVHVHHPDPFIFGGADNIGAADDARVIKDNIKPPEFFNGGLHRALAIRRDCHIALNEDRASARGVDLLFCLLPCSELMSAITTAAPSSANSCAVASPIPDAPPVTIAHLFSSLPMGSPCFVVSLRAAFFAPKQSPTFHPRLLCRRYAAPCKDDTFMFTPGWQDRLRSRRRQ